MIGLILPFFITLGGAEYTTPIVWSNKKEYDPSETVYLYGYGFKPFTQIDITVIRPDLVEDKVQTSTDEFGYFSCQYILDGVYGIYSVIATDGVNVATTTFENCLRLRAWWDSHDSVYIYAKASGLSKSKEYYIKYFDPAGVERRQSPTFTGVKSFTDKLTILPTFPNLFGWWTVKLYENGVLKRTRLVWIDRIVWTTDSTYTTLVTSFAQGETVYFKTMGLKTTKYYRFQLEMPNGTRFYVGFWTTNVTQMTGSYPLPSNAPLGTWKLHVREADDAAGTCERHYVDCRFEVTTPPPPQQYYLTVRTNPAGIGTIPGEGWYNACTLVNLTAPELFPGPTGIRYRFNYWDVDGVSNATGIYEITVHMNANRTATAHYITQNYLNLTTNPPGVTTPAGAGWYDAGTNASIFAPEFISIVPGASRYRFNGWTTGNMSEIADPSAPSTTVFMDEAKTVTANYVIEYYLTVRTSGLGTHVTNVYNGTTLLGTATDATPYTGWFEEGSTIMLNIDSPITDGSKRFVFIQWSGDVTGANRPISVIMDTAKDITANYKTQYQITVTASPNEALGGTFKVTYTQCGTTYTNVQKTTPWTEWVDAGTDVTVSEPQDIINVSPGIRCKFDSYSPSASVTMNQAKTITLVYKTQYYLTVNTNPAEVLALNPAAVSGQGWYDSGFTATVDAVQNVDKVADQSRYDFRSWTGATPTGVGNQATVFMDGPKTATANYQLQYKIIFNQSGVGTDFTGTVVIIDGANYGVDSLPAQFWWDDDSIHNFAFQSPLVVTLNAKQYVWTNTTGLSTLQSGSITVFGPGSVTGNYKTQYYLTVSSPYGTPGGQGWYDSGATAYATLNTGVVDHGNGTRRVFTNWSGDASGTNYAQSNPIIMDAPKTAIANWKTQYLLTVQTNPAGLSPQPSRNPAGEAGPANSWWYDASTNVTLTAQPVTGYSFNYWNVSGVSMGAGVNPINVTMNMPHTATAHYTKIEPLSASITPTTAKIKVGESLTFTSSVSGGKTPYSYQWYLNGTAVSGATSSTWTFTPLTTGNYTVHLVVTDSLTNTAKSNEASVTVAPPLTVSISPTSASILVGQSITFTSTVSGGYPPYSYQWYLGVSPVSGATMSTWTFTPTTSGIHHVYLKVTDANNNTAQSETARITVTAVPVGGHSISLATNIPVSLLTAYATLTVLFGLVLVSMRRKRK